MSVIVAIKENGIVYMGADSQVTKGNSRATLKNENNYKIWNVLGTKNCVMGGVGAMRDANVVRLMDDLVTDYNMYRNHISYAFMVKKIVPDIVGELRHYGFLANDKYIDGLNSSFLFAYQDQLYSIGRDCSVLEVDDFVAIGSGECEAIGSLLSTEGLRPEERIIKAIKASAANDIYVDYPIILTNTKTTKFVVINEKNEKDFLTYINTNSKEKEAKRNKKEATEIE